MPVNAFEFKELASTGTQDVQQLKWLLPDINPPRRSESAPPFLADIFSQQIGSSAACDDTQEGVLGRSNFGVSQQLRGPWDAISWGTILKHRSLDSKHLASLAEESDSQSFYTALTEHTQVPSSTPYHTSEPLATHSLPASSKMGTQEPNENGEDSTADSSRAAADAGKSHEHNSNAHEAFSVSLSLSPLRLASGDMASPSASPQGQGPLTDSPALRQHSPPHQSRLNALAPSHNPQVRSQSSAEPPLHQQAGDVSEQQALPNEATTASSDSQPAVQQAQHAGQGSAKQGGQHRRQGEPHSGQPWLSHGMRHQRSGSEVGGYPPYGQPPPPPPMAQHQRPSMQWHAGSGAGRPMPPRNHEAGAPHPTMGPMPPPQAQQAMRMGSMGVGIYPGVMPYGVLPGMHHQGGMQPPIYMPNGYMMTYYPAVPSGNMPMYGMENGGQGGQPRPATNFPQTAPFPPALDLHFAEYMQHMSQQQVFPGAPLSTLTHVERASKAGKEPASQNSGSKGAGSQHLRGPNGHHRRTPSGLSTASSATSADRDRSSRQVQDRRGDAATATNSNAGMHTRNSEDTMAMAADADHVAKATALLEQFKAKNKPQSFELKDIKGFVFEFCRDQHGSRFIQQKLADASPEEIMAVYEEVEHQVITLMQDVFGNYVIQKCFEHGSKEVLEALAGVVKSHVLALSLQMYGCRVIQKALEVLQLEQQRVIVRELQGQVMRCVRDQNGNHVIQKSIERVKPSTEIQSILEDIKGSVVGLSTHPYGCRVVQRVLEHCTIEEIKDFIREQILQSIGPLTADQYGNYVIQHMLEHGPDSARREIIEKLAGQVVRLSQHKFASNVIEKCLQYGDSASRQIIIEEVVGSPEGSTPDSWPLQMMTKDQYANYVVQKMLEVCDDSQRQLLMARITTHLNQLKKLTYGKHIVARVEKLLVAGNAATVQQESDTRLAAAASQETAKGDSTSVPAIDDATDSACDPAKESSAQHE